MAEQNHETETSTEPWRNRRTKDVVMILSPHDSVAAGELSLVLKQNEAVRFGKSNRVTDTVFCVRRGSRLSPSERTCGPFSSAADGGQLALANIAGSKLNQCLSSNQGHEDQPQTNWRGSTSVMQKLRIYLDTSIVNFLFTEDAPDFRRVTEEFFAKHARKYELFASDLVVLEIMRDSNPDHRQKLLDALRQHPVTILTGDSEVERLADLYLVHGAIPARKREDALHVAFATVHGLDILLSWNFKHLANVRREALIAMVNRQAGYAQTLRLLSPLEVEDENQT